ncbi:MAG: helix-turn-helix transcriptional regulator [Gemmatimonadota bacterium]|jgi:DNA-binding PadR family transcriptional regulator
MTDPSVGELEHLILLAILSIQGEASALHIRRALDAEGRSVTRGALYRSLDRLGDKGLVDWETREPTEARGGHAKRIYRVSSIGLAVVRDRRRTLERLWAGAARAFEGGAEPR